MDDKILTEYIVEQLGKHASRDNLIFDICKGTGMDWTQVSNLVAQVEETHKKKIAWKQSPLLFVIAIGVLVGGLWAAGGAFLYFFGLAQSGSFSFDLFALRRDYVMILRLITGLGMILGSIIGGLKLVWSLVSTTS